jgi:putative addiction module killer protein
MLPSIEIRQFVDAAGRSPFGQWFGRLDDVAAARVTTSLARLGTGHWSNVKGVGAGVFEIKIDFGPGYRVYFGKDGHTIVILLGGGTKKRQSREIEAARDRWKQYKKRKT